MRLRVWQNELERRRYLMLALAWWGSIAGYRWLHGGEFPEWDETTEEQKISIVHAYLIRNHTNLEDIFSGDDVVDETGASVKVSRDLKIAASNLGEFSAEELNDMFAKEFGINFPSTTQEESESTTPPAQPEEDSPSKTGDTDDTDKHNSADQE